jgi:hypothetical protein
LTSPDERPAAWFAQPTPTEIDTMALPAAREPPNGPTAALTGPDATLDVYYAAVACLHSWLQCLVRDLETVNGPITAQVLANEMKARLAELERADADWFKLARPTGR